MASQAEVEGHCAELIRAVQAQMDPNSAPNVRMQAITHCENFKEQSPPALGVQCGLHLSQNNNSNKCLTGFIRHFGLKLVEDIIKLRWNDMTGEEKFYIKNNAMRLMDEGVSDILSEDLHIKDVIARIVVEIAKREWPQQWPSFLTELESLCSKGNSQTELVMFVMLRLTEDVAVLQTLEQSQRRKEIYQALTSQMDIIFQFLLTLLERHYQAYVGANHENGPDRMNHLRKTHSKVCQAVLETFNAFVEWAPMANIMANDHYLIRCLASDHLLSDERLQLNAAECLHSIVGWKVGKITDRMQLLVLFKRDLIEPIFKAVVTAEQKSLQEEHYKFLKKMVQTLVELGSQLCSIWSSKESGKPKEQIRPENFDTYLNALLFFSQHPSIVVNFYANNLWAQFCRHPDISQDTIFSTYLPKWTEVASKKVVKIGLPSNDNHPSCAYSKLDFDNDEEFTSYFGRCRIILLDTIRAVSSLNPVIPYRYVDAWLRSILSQPLDLGIQSNGKCTENSPAFLQLSAIPNVLDACLTSKSTSFNDDLQNILAPAVELLKLCLDYQSADPSIISTLLSCVSSLFVVVSVTPGALMPTLDKIFSCITFGSNSDAITPNAPITGMSKEVKSLRRHGCALLVKIGQRHPTALLGVFDHLRSTIVDELHQRRHALQRMEYVTLVEALVLVSNEYADFEVQKRFLENVSSPVCNQLRSIEPVISNVDTFINYIGLDCDTGNIEKSGENRGEIAFCIQFLLAISRRSTCGPNNAPARCKNGGFIDPNVHHADKGAMFLRNPAGHVGCSVLRQILLLAKTFNDLWSPRSLSRFAPSYKKVLDMLEIEKSNVLGTTSSRCSSQQPGDDSNYHESGFSVTKDQASKGGKLSDIYKAQCFIYEQFESTYHLLAQYCVNFGHEFYRQPQLAEYVVSSVLQGLQHVPDYRLRAPIRTFLKSLINKCPTSHFSSVLVPIFNLFCPYMLTRLTEKWKQVEAMRELPTFDEDNTDSAEVITDVICRQITREYLDVVKAMLTSGGGSDVTISTTTTEVISGSNENLKAALAVTNGHNLSLSDLGGLVLQDEKLGQCVLETLLQALIWPDSQTSGRASVLLEAVLPKLSTSGQLGAAGAAHIMYTVLSAIHVLGQHEANKIALTNLAVLTYELLRPNHSSVAEMLAKVPGSNAEDIKRFDARALQLAEQRHALATSSSNGSNVNNMVSGGSSKGGAPDKILKTMFKKLIEPFIEKDVAQRFKKEVLIKNLPSLQLLKTRQKTPSLDETESSDIGLTSLFGNDSTPTHQNGTSILNVQANNYTAPSAKVANGISTTISNSRFSS